MKCFFHHSPLILGSEHLTGNIHKGEDRLHLLQKRKDDFEKNILVSLFDQEGKLTDKDLVVQPPPAKFQIESTSTSFSEFTKETKNASFSCCRFAVFSISDEQVRVVCLSILHYSVHLSKFNSD